MKTCGKCNKTKPKSEFNKMASKKDGCQPHCRECTKKYAFKYYRKNKDRWRKRRAVDYEKMKQWFKEYKETLECAKCFENHPACLVFHHNDPKEKEISISDAIKRWSKKRILIEIAKCTVLCANCHHKFHWEERNILTELN